MPHHVIGHVPTSLQLLYYTKSMLAVIFSNACTSISWVNGAEYIFVDIIPDNNNMLNLWLVDNQANNCSNLLLTWCKYNFV